MTQRTKTRGAPREAPAFVWRKGVQVADTSVWCDARRAQAICFLSSASWGPRPAHQQLIATPRTLALLGGDEVLGHGHLPVPYRKRFTVGTLQLELVPNGHGFGTAALYAKQDNKSMLYLGRPRTQPNSWGDVAEVRPVDALCIDVGDGLMPSRAPLASDIVAALASAIAGAEKPQVDILCPSQMAMHEIFYGLAKLGIAARLPKAMASAIASAMVTPTSIAATSKSSAVPLVSLVQSARKQVSDKTLLLTVAAPAALNAPGTSPHQTQFPWPVGLAIEDLTTLVATAKPRELFFTGLGANAASKLAPFDGKASVLAPPWQMSLFS